MGWRLGVPTKLLARTKAGWKGQEEHDKSIGIGDGEGNMVTDGDLVGKMSNTKYSNIRCPKFKSYLHENLEAQFIM